MDELASPVGPRKDVVQNHCLEFMQLIKVLVSQKSIYIFGVYMYINHVFGSMFMDASSASQQKLLYVASSFFSTILGYILYFITY